MLASWWLQGVAAVAVVTALVVLILAGRAVGRANAARDAAERRSSAQAAELAKALKMRAEVDATAIRMSSCGENIALVFRTAETEVVVQMTCGNESATIRQPL